MLRLWWQQPSKQTKSECSALRPDKRGACNMLCSLCVCVKEKHKHQHKHEHGHKHKHKHESSTRAEAGAKGKRIICFRLPFFVCFTFVIFACLLYHFFLTLSLSFFFAYSLYLQSVWAHPALTARLAPAIWMMNTRTHIHKTFTSTKCWLFEP